MCRMLCEGLHRLPRPTCTKSNTLKAAQQTSSFIYNLLSIVAAMNSVECKHVITINSTFHSNAHSKQAANTPDSERPKASNVPSYLCNLFDQICRNQLLPLLPEGLVESHSIQAVSNLRQLPVATHKLVAATESPKANNVTGQPPQVHIGKRNLFATCEHSRNHPGLTR